MSDNPGSGQPKDETEDDLKVYHSLVDRLDDAKEENQRILARNVLIVSGGGFAISITLLKDLFQDPIPWTNYVLVASWFLFGVSALSQIYGDHLSSKALDFQRIIFDDYYVHDDESALERDNPHTKWVKRINHGSILLLFLGLLCMLCFGTVNFLDKQGTKMKKDSNSQVVQQNRNEKDDSIRSVEPPTIRPKKKQKSNANKDNAKTE